MTKRLKTKIGDVFSIPINSKEKRYFQLIAFDLLQLNSDVIRCFNKVYPLETTPAIDSVVNDDVMFYAHCIADFGLKLNLWTKVENNSNIGNPEAVLFKSTDDYARKEEEEPVRISNNWYVWRISDEEFRKIGKLEGENRNAFNGIVFNPYGILELAKGNEYPSNYPI